MAVSLVDSLKHAIANKDSLLAMSAVRAIRVELPDSPWWASPLLQTALGGVLAVVSGVATAGIRDWRRSRALRTRLRKEIEVTSGVLDELKSWLLRQGAQALESADELTTVREGYARLADAVGPVLDPNLVHDVRVWYLRVKRLQDGTRRAYGNWEVVNSRNAADSKAVTFARLAIEAEADEVEAVIVKGRELIAQLNSMR